MGRSGFAELLQMLMTEAVEKCLFCIGAYRDNEVSSNHPLILMVEEIRKADITVSEISLKPLSLADVNQLVADTLTPRHPSNAIASGIVGL
jgi:predicted ATPase